MTVTLISDSQTIERLLNTINYLPNPQHINLDEQEITDDRGRHRLYQPS